MAKKQATSIDEIEKELGIHSLCGHELLEGPRISSGLDAFDDMMGGGWPEGKNAEVYALEGVGKSGLMYSSLASVQRAWRAAGGIEGDGKEGGMVDLERKTETKYVKKFYNLDLPYPDEKGNIVRTGIRIYKPRTAEESLNLLMRLVDTGKFSFLCVDSAPLLVPEDEYNGQVGDQSRQKQAKLVSQALRMLLARADDAKTSIVFVNQLRKTGERRGMRGMMVPIYETIGAYSLRYLCCFRIWAGRKGMLYNKAKEAIGHNVMFRIEKDQCSGRSWESCIVPFYKAGGFCPVTSTIEKAIVGDVIVQSGAWFKYNGQSIAQGMDNLRTWALNPENAETFKQIKALVQNVKTDNAEELSEPSSEYDDGEF